MGRPKKNSVDLHVCVSPRLRDYLFEEAAERGLDVSQIVADYVMQDIRDNGQVELAGEGGYAYKYRGPVVWGCGSADAGAVSSTVGAVASDAAGGREGVDGTSLLREERSEARSDSRGDGAAVVAREAAIRAECEGRYPNSLRKGRD